MLILFVMYNDAANGFHPKDELLLLQLLNLSLQRLLLFFLPAFLPLPHLIHLFFVVNCEGALLFAKLRLIVDLKVLAQKFKGMQIPILEVVDFLDFLIQKEVFLSDL